MRKYILTSPRFTGHVTFGYDDADNLIFYHNETEEEAVINWLKRNLPVNDAELSQLQTKIKGTIKEVPEDLSFDTFWDKYDKKINRKRCEPMWKKLSDAERMQAITNIKPYELYLERTGFRGKADPENYLKKEHYAVDWKREK